MTITDSPAELWVPGATQQQLTAVDVPAAAGFGVRIASSHPDAMIWEPLDNGAGVRVTMAARSDRRTIAVTAPGTDAVAIWRPGSGINRAVVNPSWVEPREHGPFTGVCMGSLVTRNGTSTLGFGATVGDGVLRARSGMVEETAQLLFMVDTDDTEQQLDVVLEFGDRAFSRGVRTLGHHMGLSRSEVTAANRVPVLCTWYSFHQDITAAGVLEEAVLASQLGFGAIIVDDGWQNSDAERGYGSCGDWQAEPAKIPDGREFVERLHELGLNVVWWIGTPFVGFRSNAYNEDTFATLYEEAGMDAAVLDPRSQAARRTLTARLTDLVRTTQADGLKLDFLERFAVCASSAPADADHTDPGRAALTLLDEIRLAVAIGGEEPMIEFREPYISPQTIPRATMLRVGDCPLSPIQNRLGILDLRLATTGIAVHSDPIMWSPSDTPERVSQHLLSSLFGVPQISVRLAELPSAQRDTLAFWMRFWNEHASLLLGDSLTVGAVEQNYPVAQVRDSSDVITVQYATTTVTVPSHAWSTWYLVNADSVNVVLDRPLPAGARVTVFDCTGTPMDGLTDPVDRLAIPTGGHARIERATV